MATDGKPNGNGGRAMDWSTKLTLGLAILVAGAGVTWGTLEAKANNALTRVEAYQEFVTADNYRADQVALTQRLDRIEKKLDDALARR